MDHKRKQQSIDGFALRRRTPQAGTTQPLGSDNMHVPERFLHDGNLPRPVPQPVAKPVVTEPALQLRRPTESGQRPQLDPTAPVPEPQKTYDPTGQGLRRADIDASLNSIDEPDEGRKAKRRGHKGKGWRPNKTFFKRLAIIVVVLLVLLGAYIGIKAFIASSKVFKGNIFDLLGQGQQLKTDQYGRSNILVFGTSEDDPDHEDAGADLTDSIMLISLDQKNKNAAMISVPRDLWVKYGKACSAGYEGKINALYQCCAGESGTKDEAAGADALKQEIGDDFGIDIQYYAHVNYTVVKQVVDAVGGVDITIESSDPRGILDRNFDWKCRYQCYYVKYPNGPTHLDGEHALYLARARNDPGAYPGYGLPQGNFDREKNQQKILTALKEKATTAGTLSNPVAVTGIIDALGDNVRTNFTGPEVKTLTSLGKDIPSDKIKSISLVDPGSMVVTTGNMGGQSIVRPVAGIYDFSEIQSYIRGKLNVMNGQEDAEIQVLNGSTSIGVASAKAKSLKADGVNVTSVGDTDANNYPAISWYDLSGGKLTKTSAKIQEVLGVAAAGTSLPAGVQSTADFVIIIGDGVN